MHVNLKCFKCLQFELSQMKSILYTIVVTAKPGTNNINILITIKIKALGQA